ncbi:glutaredoxin domain-containing protein [Marisediminitalea sp.]|uniref:glutaredoxin domain-containing protein n=1 Tax=Marisediminitalea sp. TaxID=2662268 RepID=UPI003515F3BE
MFKVYGTASCKYCHEALSLIEKLDASYEYYDIKAPANKEHFDFIVSQGFTTVPQIYFNDQYVGGYEELYEAIRKREFDDA